MYVELDDDYSESIADLLQRAEIHEILCITPRASINMQLMHIFTREWCNNFTPRRHAKNKH